jgi:hypothetical protein
MPLKLGATGITFHDNSVQTTAGGPVVDQYAIGSYILGRPLAPSTQYNNSTIAGSSLYATSPTARAQNNFDEIGQYQSTTFGAVSGGTETNILISIGSWRCVSVASSAGNVGMPGLWVRYA